MLIITYLAIALRSVWRVWIPRNFRTIIPKQAQQQKRITKPYTGTPGGSSFSGIGGHWHANREPPPALLMNRYDFSVVDA